MKTYQDLVEAKIGNELPQFVYDAIEDRKASDAFKDACIAYEYFCKKNATILQFEKWLYTVSGRKMRDVFSANYKFRNSFFRTIVEQENSYLLGEGVTFNKNDTKERLGGDAFDARIFDASEYALWGGVSFVFFNKDHIEPFKATEFVPLFGEEDGKLHAGIRFWQIDADKPLRATLYEEDGYTEYIKRKGESEFSIYAVKRPYKLIISRSEADGTEISDGGNYEGFPIVPLWANRQHQSEFEGLREKIDGYDLIQSGLANDIDEAAHFYWLIKNAGGMDDFDLAETIERLKTVHAATVDETGSIEAQTMDVPVDARKYALEDLQKSIYRDAMAFDPEAISTGNATATAIKAAYENLDLKCDRYESCVTDTIQALLRLAGIEDSPTYKRSKIINEQEETNMILSAKDYLDDETILKHLPFLSPDEVKSILAKKKREDEEKRKYEKQNLQMQDGETNPANMEAAPQNLQVQTQNPANSLEAST